MKCVMSLHSPPQRIKMEYVLQAANSRTTPSFPHASSGNPAEFGLDPRLKHSGVTILGSRISSPQPQFSAKRPKDTKQITEIVLAETSPVWTRQPSDPVYPALFPFVSSCR